MHGATITQRSRIPRPSLLYSLYVLVILALVNALAYLDRQVMVILVSPIQTDLGLTDTQMGVVIGPAFMLLFAAAGIPMGVQADRRPRNLLLAGGIAIWSVATFAIAIADSYEKLLLARACIGLGEACVVPCVFSLVADYFEPQVRGRANAVVSIGISVGAGGALFGGGALLRWATENAVALPWIGTVHPWQVVVTLFGAVGIVMAMLALTIAEPRRWGGTDKVAPGPEIQPDGQLAGESDDSFLSYLKGHGREFAVVLVPYILLVYIQVATLSWAPTLLVRRHGLDPAQAGAIVGTVIVVVPIIIMLIAGMLADHLLKRTSVGPFLLVTWVAPLMLPAVMLIAWSSSAVGVTAGLALLNVVGGMCSTTVYVAIQVITAHRFRGRQLALYGVSSQLVGLGAGPLIVASITDHVFGNPALVNQAILAAVVPAWIIIVFCGFAGRKPYARLRRLVAD